MEQPIVPAPMIFHVLKDTIKMKLAKYPAPRKAAVRGGLIVQAKYVSVCSGNKYNAIPIIKTNILAIKSNILIFLSRGTGLLSNSGISCEMNHP